MDVRGQRASEVNKNRANDPCGAPVRAQDRPLAPIVPHGPSPCPGLQKRRNPDVVRLCACERSGGAIDLNESRVPAAAGARAARRCPKCKLGKVETEELFASRHSPLVHAPLTPKVVGWDVFKQL